jgi:hypothetical protein
MSEDTSDGFADQPRPIVRQQHDRRAPPRAIENGEHTKVLTS